MSITLSFPGMAFFVLAGLLQIFWSAPTLAQEHPQDAKFAWGSGILMCVIGLIVYGLGKIG